MVLVGQSGTAIEGIGQFRDLKPDVTLMDVRLPDMNGIDASITLRASFVNARIIMLSTFQGDVEVRRALAAGASGFLLKTMPPAAILNGIRSVHAGRKCVPPEVASELADYLSDDPLSAREIEILRLVSDGNTNLDIADRLGIAESTVKVHVSNVMEKLGASDRTQAVVIAMRRGIIRV